MPVAGEANPTRLRILLAGLKLFGADGYHATSIRDIAAAGGIQSASLYSHFASKEAILGELVFIGHDAHHQILLRALVDAGAGPSEQLRSLIAAHVAAHCRYADLAIVTNLEHRHLSPAVVAPALALRERSVQLLADVVERGMTQAVFDVIDLPITLGALGGLGLSALIGYRAGGAVGTPEEVGASYAELALRLLKA